jgi:hypothetical protein
MTSEPMFVDWLREFVSRQSDPVVVESEVSLELLRSLSTSIPPVVEWEIVSAETFAHEQEALLEAGKSLGSPRLDLFETAMSAYWHDQAGLALAYRAMVLLRSAELVLPAVTLLNARELLGPAVLARAAVELAALYAHELHKLVDLFEVAASRTPGTGFVMKDVGGNVIDAEKILVRAIWGWKAEGGARDHQPEELCQLNAVTAVHKLAELVPKIAEIYGYLCQVAHPNVAGNARFWANLRDDRPGRSRVTFGRQSEGPEAERIRIATLWALGWSAATVHRWSLKLEDAVRGIFKRWPGEPRT